MVGVQIFGIKNSVDVRAAERFFKERGIPIHFVDLRKKAMAAGEIRRFVERFGWAALLDAEGRAFVDAGLRYLKLTDSELLSRIAGDPRLLRLPLVRAGSQLSIGQNEVSWKAMLDG